MKLPFLTSAKQASDPYSDTQLYFRIFQYLKPYKTRFIWGALISLPSSALEGALAWAVGPLVDTLQKEGGENLHILFWVPPAILLISLIQGICEYASQYATSYVSSSITRDLRDSLFEKLVLREVPYFKRNTAGHLVNRYVNDPARLQQAIVNNLQDFVFQFFALVSLAGVLFYRNWWYATIALAIISLIAIPLAVISRKVRQMDHQVSDFTIKMMNVFYDFLGGVKIIKTNSLIQYQRKRYREAMDKIFSVSMSATKAGIILKPVMQMIAACGLSLVVLMGSFEVMNGRMTLGDLASFLVALILLYKPAKTLGSVAGKIQRIFSPAERVFEKLDEPIQITEVENPVQLSEFKTLEMQDISFEYEPGKPVLKGIDFNLRAGEKVALVGPSGGGKSTLVDLIPRFIDPTHGSVRINGIDLREVSLESLYSLISIVTQEPFLFETSIRENIRLGSLTATDEEIWAAVEAAHLTEWINTLPDGLDTWVGERGVNLSGGQRQRVTIARAFLKNPPLLILDEATSALDNESEYMVQQALMALQANRTVIVIAHRLSTIRFADRICVLSNGAIVETGTHEELLASKGIYEKYHYLQYTERGEGLLNEGKSAAVKS